MMIYLRQIILIVVCIFSFLLQSCVVGDSCNAVDQSKVFADPEWIKNNLDKRAFDFDCEAKIFPPLGSQNRMINTVSFLVKDIYWSMERPIISTLAQSRAYALFKARESMKNFITLKYPEVKDVFDISCKETYMLDPGTVRVCEFDEVDRIPPEIELPPGGGELPPTPQPADHHEDL